MSQKLETKKVNPEKENIVNKVSSLASKYPVIVVASLSKVRGEQLMSLRKSLRGSAELYVVKNKLAMIGLKRTSLKNIENMEKYLTGQNVLIFTKHDPFKLYLLLEKNKVYLPARAGDVAPEDIIVPAGNTGLPAGPVLSEFREAGVQTKIEAGSIWVTKDSVVAKKGTVITPKLASLLSKLNIKPIKAGISIVAAYQDGVIYPQDAVAIDLERYRSSILESYSEALSLALSIGYITRETANYILAKAYRDAMALSVQAGYITKETAPLVLARAEAEANLLSSLVSKKKS